MKKVVLIAMLTAAMSPLANAKFSITDSHANLGTGQIVTLEQENKFNLVGSQLKAGDFMPSVSLMTSNLQPFDTSVKDDSVKVYSILTSVDTPVCVQQAVELSEFVNSHQKQLKGIEFYAISADTPFAQQRFIKEHELSGVEYLSDSKNHEFGEKSGSLIKELGLLTRSIVVVDKHNKIQFLQRVPELTTLPDLEAAVLAAKQSL